MFPLLLLFITVHLFEYSAIERPIPRFMKEHRELYARKWLLKYFKELPDDPLTQSAVAHDRDFQYKAQPQPNVSERYICAEK